MSTASASVQDKQQTNADAVIPETEQAVFKTAASSLLPSTADLTATLQTSASISKTDLQACFDLIEQTSSAAYKASSRGWCPKQKWREMKEDGMRYILLTAPAASEANRNIVGFISYMITEEDGHDVSYVYEIHLSAEIQGKGVGSSLMKIVDKIAVAVGMKMVMLTVFTSNEGAIKLYERLGFEKWDEEPIISKRKKLRSGVKEIKPSYVILAKDLKNES